MIVAMDSNRVIGYQNGFPANWNAPGDLKRFKEITLNKCVIMGRKTYESIKKPLIDRYNIIISSSLQLTDYQNLVCVKTPKEALERAKNTIHLSRFLAQQKTFTLKNNVLDHEIMICGGGTIYKEFLELTDKLYLTIVNGEHQGDTFFPEINFDQWDLIETKELLTHSYLTYQRKIPMYPSIFPSEDLDKVNAALNDDEELSKEEKG